MITFSNLVTEDGSDTETPILTVKALDDGQNYSRDDGSKFKRYTVIKIVKSSLGESPFVGLPLDTVLRQLSSNPEMNVVTHNFSDAVLVPWTEEECEKECLFTREIIVDDIAEILKSKPIKFIGKKGHTSVTYLSNLTPGQNEQIGEAMAIEERLKMAQDEEQDEDDDEDE